MPRDRFMQKLFNENSYNLNYNDVSLILDDNIKLKKENKQLKETILKIHNKYLNDMFKPKLLFSDFIEIFIMFLGGLLIGILIPLFIYLWVVN